MGKIFKPTIKIKETDSLDFVNFKNNKGKKPALNLSVEDLIIANKKLILENEEKQKRE